MIVIISAREHEEVGYQLYQYLKEDGEEVCFFDVSDWNIKPCYGCGKCADKMPAECVVRDDMDGLLPMLRQGDVIVCSSRVYWGGVSYPIKLVLDKMALTGSRFYKVRENELVKGHESHMKKLFGIGVEDTYDSAYERDYHKYFREVARIVDVKGQSRVVRPFLNRGEISGLAEAVRSE